MKVSTGPSPWITAGAAAALSFALTGAAQAAEKPADLPSTLVWSAYDLGSSGYTDASAIANALQKHYDMRIRIVPSGTSIGRLLPMTTGKVAYGFLGNEAFFASEGTFDFAVKQWGPQDLRILMGRPSAIGIAMTRCEGGKYKTYYDLKGAKIGYVTGSPTVNVKNDAFLAFGNLTRDDIEPVWFGGWSQQVAAAVAGQIDGMNNVPTSAQVREIEASPGGVCWPEMPPDDKEGWARTKKVASFLSPMRATSGAGLSEENPKDMAGYRYPLLTTYARTSADEVYALLSVMHKHFDEYKDATSASKGWAIDVGGRPPYDAPAHEGTVRFLKDQGVWQPEDQAWNEERLARLEKVQAGWDEAVASFDEWRAEQAKKGEDVNADEAWPEYWEKYRAENL